MPEVDGKIPPAESNAPPDEGWDPVAEQWDSWSPVIDALFKPATLALLEMLDLRAGEKVLELAAGSGGLTLYLASAVGPTGQVVATDLGPKMLRLAARNARAAGLTNVTTQVMDGQAPDVGEASVDVVACRQGLMLFPDSAAALPRLFRVIRPGGRLGVTVFSSPERNGFVSTPVAAVSRWSKPKEGSVPLTPGPGPFSLGAPGQLEGLLRRSGFGDVRSRLVASSLRLKSVEEYMRFYREILPGFVAEVADSEKEAAWAAIARATSKYVLPGSTGAPCEILVVLGQRPGAIRQST